MLEDFLSYIESNLSVNREDKILLAVSGGIDSMVMLHLFRQLDLQYRSGSYKSFYEKWQVG